MIDDLRKFLKDGQKGREAFRAYCRAYLARIEEIRRRNKENEFNDAFFNNPIPIEERKKYSVVQLKFEF